MPKIPGGIPGGGERTRTADFYVANVALNALIEDEKSGHSVARVVSTLGVSSLCHLRPGAHVALTKHGALRGTAWSRESHASHLAIAVLGAGWKLVFMARRSGSRCPPPP